MVDSAVEYAIRSLEEELSDFDKTVDIVVDHRKKITDNLMRMNDRLGKMTDDLDITDPKSMGAMATLVGTTLKALTDTEATAMRRVNAKLKQADQKRTDSMNEVVGEIIQRMARKDREVEETLVPESFDDVDKQLTKTFLSGEGDAILETELRTDDEDLS